MSCDSASLCCSRIYFLSSGDLLIVAVSQNAIALGLFTELLGFFFLLRTLRYKHSLQYPAADSLGQLLTLDILLESLKVQGSVNSLCSVMTQAFYKSFHKDLANTFLGR
jgi:hypothetical protein